MLEIVNAAIFLFPIYFPNFVFLLKCVTDNTEHSMSLFLYFGERDQIVPNM